MRFNNAFHVNRQRRVEIRQQHDGRNMWLADEKDLAGLELRYPDGQNWSGEGEFGYVRAARIID